MNILLKGLSPIYYSATKLRNKLYDKDLLETVKLNTPVVCIGNISFGGSGKTPFTRWLCLQDSLLDKKIAIVSRAYRAKYSGDFLKLEEKHFQQPENYGDEACMLASSLPQVDVFITNNKSKACEKLVAQSSYDIILVDDGFQHRRLQRDLDIVLLDSSVGIESYNRFPKGELREDLSGLKRADLFVYSKANTATPSLMDRLSQYTEDKPQIVMGYDLGAPSRVTPKDSLEILEKSFLNYILVTAVGNPKQVEESFKKTFGEAKDQLIFKDHHSFTDLDIEMILHILEKKKAKYILCTEKDYLKIRNKMKNSSSLYFVPQDYKLLAGKEEMDEKLRALFS